MTSPKFSIGRIILIDDDSKQLGELDAAVKAALHDEGCEVIAWLPEAGDVLATFDGMVANGATLVVTDYDLTKGASGFFGASVVAWCQERAIPVGDYSRGNRQNIPKEPNLFEFRFESSTTEGAAEIAAIYRGFKEIWERFVTNAALLTAPSPANMLAELLGHPGAVSAFSLYTPQIGTNASLFELVQSDRSEPSRRALSSYILGHLLFNSILRYPGPLLDARAACSYFAVADSAAGSVESAITAAAYDGPFAELGPFYWRAGIDDLVDGWAENSDIEYSGDQASYRRALLEQQLGAAPLERYNCPRCQGELGGYRCPFTDAVVCERSDCSIGSSGWIPLGADLSRVERVFFDETSPMLGS
ncbi:hypothetical protein [Sphingomonas asaccharolytica]|uniref:hypothetical protein n=1 Tax=Sphingomonas asaccharolytica TaxID=40681 RepID=UPI0008349FA7|nr:hypothetical protein [Sphingomonas asaccharolytica]